MDSQGKKIHLVVTTATNAYELQIPEKTPHGNETHAWCKSKHAWRKGEIHEYAPKACRFHAKARQSLAQTLSSRENHASYLAESFSKVEYV